MMTDARRFLIGIGKTLEEMPIQRMEIFFWKKDISRNIRIQRAGRLTNPRLAEVRRVQRAQCFVKCIWILSFWTSIFILPRFYPASNLARRMSDCKISSHIRAVTFAFKIQLIWNCLIFVNYFSDYLTTESKPSSFLMEDSKTPL